MLYCLMYCLHSTPAGSTDLTHINILAELYMEAGLYEQANTLIRRAERLLLDNDDNDGGRGGALPLDLTIKAGETR